jgi:hypothetical protein
MFTVTVRSYSLAANQVGQDRRLVWSRSHRSPREAARTLAQIISGRTDLARHVRALVGTGRGGQYTIATLTGTEMALVPFRHQFGITA